MATETSESFQKKKERAKVRAAAWARSHPDRRAEICRQWYLNNPEKGKINAANYRKRSRNKYLLMLAKRRAKQRGIDFDISLEDVVIPDKCPLLGIPIDNFHTDQKYHASLDRIDPSKGYVKGNVMVISHRANMLKNNASCSELLCLAYNLGKITGEFD